MWVLFFSDMEVHLSNLKDSGQDVVFSGHSAPLIGVAIDPKDEYVVCIKRENLISHNMNSIFTWNVSISGVIIM